MTKVVSRTTVFIFVTVLAVALVGGCGGGGDGEPGISAPVNGQAGSVVLHIQWPERAEIDPRLIPELSDFIEVEIRDVATDVVSVSDLLERPEEAPWVTEVTYHDVLASANARLTAAAYPVNPNEDPAAVAQASGSMQIVIPAGGVAYPRDGSAGDPINLVMDSTVDSVTVTAETLELEVGETLQLAATAHDADGSMVLVPSFTWSSGNENASVDAEGLVTGEQVGRSAIIATEVESGVSGSVTVEVTSFVHLSGVNLPWINYGHDVGLAHTWEATHDGFSSNVERLRADLQFAANHGVKLVRLFIFCDLRGGIIFDDDRMPQRFDDYVFDDFQTLLDEASALGLRLMPVLFDYTIADEVTTEVTVGEYPELITDPERRDELLAILRPFLEQFGSDPTIYAWDIINEPKYATAVELADMQEFVAEIIDLIREVAPEALVTVGLGDRGELQHWTDAGFDLYQIHYYEWMESHYPLDFPAADLGLDRPVIMGEIEPTDVADRLDLLRENGYAGVVFWSLNADYDFRGVAAEYRDWVAAQEPPT